MKRRLWQTLALITLLLAGVVVSLPASLLSLPLARATDGRWQLNNPQGTLWRGDTQLVYLGAGGEVLAMSKLGWQLQPKALLSGKLAWQLDSNGQPGQLLLGVSEQQLNGLSFNVPVAALANLSKTWQAARLGGELQLQVPQFTRQGGQLGGALQLSWRGAASPISSVLPFGSYQLDVVGSGSGLALNVSTLDGPLLISGHGNWQPGGAFSLAGNADSPPEKYDALKPLLLMLGQPAGPTSVSWQIRPGA